MKLQTFFQNYARWLERHYGKVLLVSLFLSFFGFWYSGQLYKNLRTDIEELLPASAPSVQDLHKATGRVTGLNHLEIVIESNDVAAAKRLQIDITKKLDELPKDIVSKVKDNIHFERDFFESRQSLYVDLNDWKSIENYIHEQKRAARKKAFSLGIDDSAPAKKSDFSFKDMEDKYSKRVGDFANFKDDYFQSNEGKTRIILAFLPGKVTGMSGNEALSDAAKKIIDELNPKSYASDMRVGLGGDVQNMVEEHNGLVSDLITSFVIVTVLVTLVLWLYYKSVGAVMALSLSLFAGVSWTFGLSYWLVGYLNANTAFLGSIVIGNGINFGIIFLARYVEERRRNAPVAEALPSSMYFTSRATLTAALAAACSYGSLVLTSFRGFNQFGIIGALGMFLCWISAFTTMPALLLWFEDKHWIRHRVKSDALPLMRSLANFVLHSYRTICWVTVAASLVALFGVSKFSKNTLESDLSKLRNKESMLHGSGFWGKKVDDAFHRNLTPTIVLTESPEDTQKVYAEIKKIQAREGDNSPFGNINVVEDFVPQNQKEKIEIIDSIRKELTPEVLKKLKPAELKQVNDFLPKRDPSFVRAQDLPPDILVNFLESNGQIGHMVHVYPQLKSDKKDQSTWNGDAVIRYTALLREAIHNAGVTAVIAGQPPISADMLQAITQDGPKATFWAFFSVVLLVVLMFPKPKHFLGIVASLCLGVVWMMGVMSFLDWKINFLNFITLPITFGVGVDYAVNIFGRFHAERTEEKGQSILSVISQTGGAVVLCSSTTIIGYSSLLISGSQAFVSFGKLAVLGEFTCIVAAIIALPAFWLAVQQRKKA